MHCVYFLSEVAIGHKNKTNIIRKLINFSIGILVIALMTSCNENIRREFIVNDEFGKLKIQNQTIIDSILFFATDKNELFRVNQKLEVEKLNLEIDTIYDLRNYMDTLFISNQQDKYYKVSLSPHSISYDTQITYLYSSLINKPSSLFNDNQYQFTSCCQGEWGGTIMIKDNLTGKEYATVSTCPQLILSKNNEYYVVSNLPHMRGYSSVLKLQNIKALPVVDIDSINCNEFYDLSSLAFTNRQIRDSVKQILLGDTLSNYRLFDTLGISILQAKINQNERDRFKLIYWSHENGSINSGEIINGKVIFENKILGTKKIYQHLSYNRLSSNEVEYFTFKMIEYEPYPSSGYKFIYSGIGVIDQHDLMMRGVIFEQK